MTFRELLPNSAQKALATSLQGWLRRSANQGNGSAALASAGDCGSGTEPRRASSASELAGYIAHHGEQLYFVLHRAERPQALALLAGPFATERPLSYAAWIRWARFLAGHGITAMHFDYQGVGESSGRFENASLNDWCGDITACAGRLQQEAPEKPMAIVGLGVGGLLAEQEFKRGLGDALLLWSPAASGEAALREILVRRMLFDYGLAGQQGPIRIEDYISRLERGETVNVEGYRIGARLWREAASVRSRFSDTEGADDLGRRWRVVKLGGGEVPLVANVGLWRALNPRSRITRCPLNPDLSSFFQQNLQWVNESIVEGRPGRFRS